MKKAILFVLSLFTIITLFSCSKQEETYLLVGEGLLNAPQNKCYSIEKEVFDVAQDINAKVYYSNKIDIIEIKEEYDFTSGLIYPLNLCEITKNEEGRIIYTYNYTKIGKSGETMNVFIIFIDFIKEDNNYSVRVKTDNYIIECKY